MKQHDWRLRVSILLVLPWWRHQMETFSALLVICAGKSPVPGEFPTQRPGTRSFDVFFDLRLNRRLSKQSWGWWFEMLSRPLWCHCNAMQRQQTWRHDNSQFSVFGRWVSMICSKTCLATVIIRSIFAREKLHERFSASAVFPAQNRTN